MLTKIFSAVVLLQLNFTIMAQPRASLYSKIVEQYPEILSGETQFCKSDNAYYWAAVCRQVLINIIRDTKKYESIYLDYQSFTSTAAASKCQNRTVFLKDYDKYGFPNPHINHHMAVCPCRAITVPKYRKSKAKTYTTIIAITPLPNHEENVLVFENYFTENYYVPSIMMYNLHYSEIPEVFFTQAPPTSTMHRMDLESELNKLEADLKNRISESGINNIVEKSDKYFFARLCLMISISKPTRNYSINMGELCKEKPNGMYLTVNTNKFIKTPLINNLLTYPCSPPEKFVQPDSKDALQKWEELQTLFAVSRGANDESLIVYQYKHETSNSIKFKPVELIKNVFEEFLREIRIPKTFKEECEFPVIPEQVEHNFRI